MTDRQTRAATKRARARAYSEMFMHAPLRASSDELQRYSAATLNIGGLSDAEKAARAGRRLPAGGRRAKTIANLKIMASGRALQHADLLTLTEVAAGTALAARDALATPYAGNYKTHVVNVSRPGSCYDDTLCLCWAASKWARVPDERPHTDVAAKLGGVVLDSLTSSARVGLVGVHWGTPKSHFDYENASRALGALIDYYVDTLGVHEVVMPGDYNVNSDALTKLTAHMSPRQVTFTTRTHGATTPKHGFVDNILCTDATAWRFTHVHRRDTYFDHFPLVATGALLN